MLDRILSYVNQYQMIKEHDRLVAGVSGGADSVCLVLVLLEIAKKIPLTLEIAHLNHGIRGEEAIRDALFVEKLCREHNLAFHLKNVDIPRIAEELGISEEEAGRRERYAFFESVMKECNADKIVVAHNKNDSAETMLFNLIRGTGLKGLCGIMPVNGNIIRPLLCVERDEIEAFLAERQVPFCMDSTNLGESYTRNKIRNKILPYIKEELNPGVIEAVSRAGDNLRMVSDYLEKQADELEENMITAGEGVVRMQVEPVEKLPEALSAELVVRAFEKVSGSRRDFGEKHRRQIFQILHGESGRQTDLPYGVTVKKEYGELIFLKKGKEGKNEPFCMEIPLRNGRYYLNNEEYVEILVENYKKDEIISEKKYTKWFDYDIISGTLQIRNRKAGDKISVTKDGGRKKLKDYFINEKISRAERDNILLLTDEREVIWVLGHRISESYKIRPHTKRVLKVRYGGNTYGTED